VSVMEVVVVDKLRKRHVFGRHFGYIRSDSRKRKKKMRSGGVDAVFSTGQTPSSDGSLRRL